MTDNNQIIQEIRDLKNDLNSTRLELKADITAGRLEAKSDLIAHTDGIGARVAAVEAKQARTDWKLAMVIGGAVVINAVFFLGIGVLPVVLN